MSKPVCRIMLPPETCRKRFFFFFFFFCQQSLAFLGLQMHHCNLCLCIYMAFPSCVCFFSITFTSVCMCPGFPIWTQVTLDYDINFVLFTFTMSLFPNKVKFTDWVGQVRISLSLVMGRGLSLMLWGVTLLHSVMQTRSDLWWQDAAGVWGLLLPSPGFCAVKRELEMRSLPFTTRSSWS